MTPQQKAFLPPFCSAVLEWEASSTFPFKRQISIVTVAQAALETGWGKSSLCKYNNFGGIKDHPNAWLGIEKQTREVINGKDVIEKQEFETYPTIKDFIEDHSHILLRWKCIRHSAGISVLVLCEALGPWSPEDWKAQKAGKPDDCQHSNYSTDPHYGQVLMQIIEGLGLTTSGRLEQLAAY